MGVWAPLGPPGVACDQRLGAVGVAPSASVNLDGVAVILFPRGVAAADP